MKALVFCGATLLSTFFCFGSAAQAQTLTVHTQNISADLGGYSSSLTKTAILDPDRVARMDRPKVNGSKKPPTLQPSFTVTRTRRYAPIGAGPGSWIYHVRWSFPHGKVAVQPTGYRLVAEYSYNGLGGSYESLWVKNYPNNVFADDLDLLISLWGSVRYTFKMQAMNGRTVLYEYVNKPSFSHN